MHESSDWLQEVCGCSEFTSVISDDCTDHMGAVCLGVQWVYECRVNSRQRQQFFSNEK